MAAAIETDQAETVREMTSASQFKLPIYIASPETRRRYGAERADPPLHVLIDAAGHVIAIARGAGRPTIDRIADQAKRQLDELDPLGDTRFVSAPSRGVPGLSKERLAIDSCAGNNRPGSIRLARAVC